MDFFLSKLLPLFVYPLGIGVLLGLGGVLVALRRRAFGAAALGLLGIAVLAVASAPRTAGWLMDELEAPFAGQGIDALPNADAIVVLGGILSAPEGALGAENLSDAADRLLHAKHLFDAGKAPRILVSGGSAAGWVPEADLMAGLLIEFGVPPQVILRERASRNTRQNALGTRALMDEQGLKSALLVTSGFHMRRALGTFRAAGIDAHPAPTDFQAGGRAEYGVLDWLPDAQALGATTGALKEHLGWWVYRLRGWAN